MKLTRTLLGATAVAALMAGTAWAEPALIYDLGGKFDKSFNEMAFTGATRWAQETGGEFRDIELQSERNRGIEEALKGGERDRQHFGPVVE